jgi:flagellar biosynthetic protein FliO
MGLELVQAVFLFAVVLLLAWLSTRLVGARMSGAGRGRLIRVLEHVPAGRDRSLLLVAVGGKIHLVGATADQISLLDTVADPEAVSRLLAQVPADQNPLGLALPASFRDVLEKMRTGGRTEPDPSAATGGEIERLEQQLERLRRLQGK